jgi:2-keto-3-deoxy-L-fuconate dehydrogenase
MMFSLQNKKAVITGAGSGIGKAMALLFAKQGATVIILELNAVAAEDVVKEIIDAGGTAEAYSCNVAIQKEVLEVFAKFGTIDIFINNAGIAHIGKATTTSEADFDRVMNVNVKGAYNCLYAAIPLLQKNGGGAIINMASVAASVGLADRFVYSTTKGAVAAMTLSVAKDYMKDNIRCNSISPARVHTPFIDGYLKKSYPGKEAEMFEELSKSQPIGRMGTTAEVAAMALYLCSDEAAFITGNDYFVDGGFIKLNT